MMDIVFPENNEKECAEMARALGYTSIVLAYPAKRVPKTLPPLALPTKIAVLAEPDQARSLRARGNIVLVKSSEKDRQVLESGAASVLFGCEGIAEKDRTHQRASGLNHVLCAIASRKNVAVGFSFSELLHALPRQRAILIGRMQQNIRLCRKYKTPLRIGSFARNPYEMRGARDLMTLFTVLGMHPAEARTALSGF